MQFCSLWVAGTNPHIHWDAAQVRSLESGIRSARETGNCLLDQAHFPQLK